MHKALHSTCCQISHGMVQAWVGHFVKPITLPEGYSLVLFDIQQVTTTRQDATHNTSTQQTPPSWWQSRQPLRRRGIDESMPPKGHEALHIALLKPLSNFFDGGLNGIHRWRRITL